MINKHALNPNDSSSCLKKKFYLEKKANHIFNIKSGHGREYSNLLLSNLSAKITSQLRGQKNK